MLNDLNQHATWQGGSLIDDRLTDKEFASFQCESILLWKWYPVESEISEETKLLSHLFMIKLEMKSYGKWNSAEKN